MTAAEQPGNPLLDAALGYARRGWHVFPTHDVSQGSCSCARECSSPGKHPRTTHGFKDATTDELTIAGWWTQWPQANIAIDCGASGVAAIDVDVKNGAQGKATMKWVLERHAEFAHAELNETPTGGYHFIFAGEIGSGTNTLGAGVDTRGIGGYILLPPSRVFGLYDENKRPVPGSQAAYKLMRAAPVLPLVPLFEHTPPAAASADGFRLGDIAGTERTFDGEERDAIPFGSHRSAMLQFTWHLRRVLGLSIDAAVPLVEAFLEKLDGYNPADPFNTYDIRKMLGALEPHIAKADTFVLTSGESRTGADAQLAHRPMSWIVPRFFPDYELALLYGEGGTGKSTLFSWLAAIVTQLGGNFGVIGIEEPFERFVARSVAMGADPRKLISPVESCVALKFREHIDWIENFIASNDLRYLYFDSLRTHFDGARGEDSATSARNNLSGIASLAQRTCGIGATFHTNKEAIYSGSTEMLNVPRVVIEAKNPSEDKLTLRVHKGNFKKPDYKLAFMREEIPYYVNGAPVMEMFHQIGAPAISTQETLPIWRQIDNEPVKGGSLAELAGLEPQIREILEKDPKMSGRAVFEIVGGNNKKCFEIVARIKREIADA